MRYQVVARSGDHSSIWEYYPYWAPVREKDAAERLAGYAAQSGYEAAILQAVTPEALKSLAYRVVERHETELLPALRYLPESAAGRASGRQNRAAHQTFRPIPALDPSLEGYDTAELDRRRLRAELGPGGDVLACGTRQPDASLPMRMDVISTWLRLRERVLSGALGGGSDGASVDDASASD